MTNRTVGVEEEFLLVDASGERIRTADNELAAAMAKKKDPAKAGEVQSEFKREQAETNTPPCLELGDLGGQLVTMRQALAAAVEPNGVGIAAVGTSPLKVQSTTTDNKRYHAMADEYAILAREQLSCGCHVHVAVDSREEGVAVLDRIRPWLSVLAAISGNSHSGKGKTRDIRATGQWSGAAGRAQDHRKRLEVSRATRPQLTNSLSLAACSILA